VQPEFADLHRGLQDLLPRAALWTFQFGLPPLHALPLRFADNKGSTAEILGAIQFLVGHENSYFRMKRILAAVLLLTLCLLAQNPSTSDSLFSELDGISHDLEQITGLKFKKTVASAVMDKDQLRDFLSHRVEKVMKPADIKAETLTLRMLGLIPDDYDLKQETVDLLTEQAAAFYDYQKKKLFIMKGETGEAALMALAHEMAHALADQNFHLAKFIKSETESDDAATARMAVMEGQATWLMSCWLHQRAGLGAEVPEPILKMMSESVEQSASQYPVYSQSPLYVRESLTFPYKGGMLFQDAVYRKLGQQSFGEVFRRAPVSTQQVLHPDRYLEHMDPKIPDVPVLPDRKQFRKLSEGMLGEFDLGAMLTQYAGEETSKDLAPSLVGSQFALFENKKQGYPVLVWSSRWSTPENAQRFLHVYRDVLQKKSKDFKPGPETDTQLDGRTDKGMYRVVLKGDTIECVEGLQAGGS
jgi:hypothetical protein